MFAMEETVEERGECMKEINWEGNVESRVKDTLYSVSRELHFEKIINLYFPIARLLFH